MFSRVQYILDSSAPLVNAQPVANEFGLDWASIRPIEYFTQHPHRREDDSARPLPPL